MNPRFHYRLAGRGYTNLYQIQDDFSVTIKLPKEKESDKVAVSGRKDDVHAAIEYIREVVKEIELDMKQEAQTEDRPKRDSHQQHHGNNQPGAGRTGGGNSRQGIQTNDPFFAPPPQSASNVDKTSVWGARMS